MLKILPRDEKYFERFTEIARRVHDGAKALDQFFGGQSEIPLVAEKVKSSSTSATRSPTRSCTRSTRPSSRRSTARTSTIWQYGSTT